MRKAVICLGVLCTLSGCSQAPQARPQMPSFGRNAPKMSPEEIGKSAFGSLFQSARTEGETAEFVFAAPEDISPSAKYRRAVILTATAIPTELRNEPDVKKIRFTTVDAKQPSRRLAVFTIGRDEGKKVGGHGSFDALLDVVKVEYADPEYRDATAQSLK